MAHRVSRFEAFDAVVPDVGNVTLAEINGKLVVVGENALITRNDPQIERVVGTRYLSLTIPYKIPLETLSKPSTNVIILEQASESSSPSLHEFTPVALWRWIDAKQKQILQHLIRYPLVQQALQFQEIIRTVFIDLIRTRLPTSLNFIIGDDYYDELKLFYQRAPVKMLAWHRYRSSFSIVHRQDVVFCYDTFAEDIGPRAPLALVHELQTDVTALEWKPNSGSVLAVAVKTGVCLWRIKYPAPKQLTTSQPLPFTATSASNASLPLFEPNLPTDMDFLSYPGFTKLTSLSWSPDGQMLVVASATTSMMVVWDYMNMAIPIRPPGLLGGGTKKVIFSPCGSYLLQVCKLPKMWIWDTRAWTHTEVSLRSPCQDAVWTLDGSRVIFALEDDAALYSIHVDKGPPLAARVIVPERPEDIRFVMHGRVTSTGKEVFVGGPIKCLALDPITGTRLAICFEETASILLCRLTPSPTPEYHPIGFVRGPYWDAAITEIPISPYQSGVELYELDVNLVPSPHCVSLAFSRGSKFDGDKSITLSMVWEEGTIQQFPFTV